jgi:hypothetical protein
MTQPQSQARRSSPGPCTSGPANIAAPTATPRPAPVAIAAWVLLFRVNATEAQSAPKRPVSAQASISHCSPCTSSTSGSTGDTNPNSPQTSTPSMKPRGVPAEVVIDHTPSTLRLSNQALGHFFCMCSLPQNDAARRRKHPLCYLAARAAANASKNSIPVRFCRRQCGESNAASRSTCNECAPGG